MDYKAPLPENVIPVGGLHIKEPKPIPKVLNVKKNIFLLSNPRLLSSSHRLWKPLSTHPRKASFYSHWEQISSVRTCPSQSSKYFSMLSMSFRTIISYGNSRPTFRHLSYRKMFKSIRGYLYPIFWLIQRSRPFTSMVDYWPLRKRFGEEFHLWSCHLDWIRIRYR